MTDDRLRETRGPLSAAQAAWNAGDIETILEYLRSTNRLLRIMAASCVRDTSNPRIFASVTGLLLAGDVRLRIAGVRALQWSNERRAIPELLKMAESDESFEARVAAMDALFALGEERVAPLIVKGLEEAGPSWKWRGWYARWACRRLTEMSASDTAEALERVARDMGLVRRWRVRRAATRLRASRRIRP